MAKTLSRARVFDLFGYYPHDAQMVIHESPARFLICAGGARLGKSLTGGAESALEFLLPDRHIYLISSQYDLAQKEFDWAIKFLNNYKINGQSVTSYCKISNSERGSKVVKAPWGSWIRTKSTEKPTSLLGDELDLAVLCEASQLSKSVYERYIRERLTQRKGRLLACSTPNADGGLLWYLYNKAETEPGWARWLFPSIANPTFSAEEYETMRRELDAKVFAEQCEGKFISRRGKVFEVNETNLTNDVPKETWPIIAGIYYKSNNPCGVVFLAVNPETREYLVFDEIYEANKAPIDIFPEIKKRIAGKTFLGLYCDHWDAAIQKEIGTAGIVVGTNRKEKEIGKTPAYIRRVYAVQGVLKIRQSNTPRLRISRKCANLLNDLEKAKWPDRKTEEEEREEQQLPLTKFMTMPLALSYPIAFMEMARGVDYYAMEEKRVPVCEENKLGAA